MILRKTRREEAAASNQCIEDAREFHASLGFTQWKPDYPTIHNVERDIENGTGYVFVEGDELIGAVCLTIGEEPSYREIDGAWKTDREYMVIRRLAFSKNSIGKKLSEKAISLIKEFCIENGLEAIRVDTLEENRIMQHVLSREGFEYCGLINFGGGPKLAYEWDK